MDLNSLTDHLKMSSMSDLSFQLRTTVPRPPRRRTNDREGTCPPGICVPSTLSQDDLDDIRRCFKRANVKVPGYLDCKELKDFMTLRHCPITQWEAEKLLEYADPVYSYYISLDQVAKLASNFGIGTSHPLRLTRSEFEVGLRNAFYTEEDDEKFQVAEAGRSMSTLHHSVSEETVTEPANDPVANERSKPGSLEVEDNSKRDFGMQANMSSSTSRIMPVVQVRANESNGTLVNVQPLEPVSIIRDRWEKRIQKLIDTNSDDFLRKLETENNQKQFKRKEERRVGNKQNVVIDDATLGKVLPPPLPDPIDLEDSDEIYSKWNWTLPLNNK